MFNEKINSPAVVGGSLALIGIPLVMIFKQPNLSTTLVTLVVFLALIFTAKISYRWILGAFGVLIPILTTLFSLFGAKVRNGFRVSLSLIIR